MLSKAERRRAGSGSDSWNCTSAVPITRRTPPDLQVTQIAPPTHATVGQGFTFTYEEPTARGEGWFELQPGGEGFQGQWRQQGQVAWRPWIGKRAKAPTRRGSFAGLWTTSFGKLRLIQSEKALQDIQKRLTKHDEKKAKTGDA